MLGIVSLMIFLFVYREHGVYLGWSGGDNAWSPVQRALYATAAATIPMMLWAVFVDKVHLRPSAGLNLGTPPPPPRTTKRYLSALIPVGILWVVLLGAFWGWWSLLGPVGWADYFWDHLINPRGAAQWLRGLGVPAHTDGVRASMALVVALTLSWPITTFCRGVNFERSAIKLLGLLGCFGLGAALYWTFPEYGLAQEKPKDSFYYGFYVTLNFMWPWLLAFAPPYILYTDSRMREPQDGYWNLGMLLSGHVQGRDWNKLRELILGWLVKIFFLPLMFLFFSGKVKWAVTEVVPFGSVGEFWDMLTSTDSAVILKFYHFIHTFIMMFDVAYGAIGYAMTFRLFDSHIRTAEPTMFGWVVAIMCYKPFWESVFSGHYFRYNDGQTWELFRHMPYLQIFVSMTALVLFTMYVWSTVSFGLRFSNLTHRGIITHGPYRWFKHPAYISKNTAWWFMFMPFAAQMNWADALRSSLLLLGVNAIYLVRALTEERNLGQDPGYRAYQAYMYEHGLYARLIRRPLRRLTFRDAPPQTPTSPSPSNTPTPQAPSPN